MCQRFHSAADKEWSWHYGMADRRLQFITWYRSALGGHGYRLYNFFERFMLC
jgi:hypothetical protein